MTGKCDSGTYRSSPRIKRLSVTSTGATSPVVRLDARLGLGPKFWVEAQFEELDDVQDKSESSHECCQCERAFYISDSSHIERVAHMLLTVWSLAVNLEESLFLSGCADATVKLWSAFSMPLFIRILTLF